MANDNADLEHFLQAQSTTYDTACRELAAGQKESHWMWFIFPQLAGLGRSPMAARYALDSLAQAGDYLRHPVLGPRLVRITGIVNTLQNRTASELFGFPDDLKFHSSMTLFALATARAAQPEDAFHTALDRYFNGRMDEGTLNLLS